MAIEIPSSSQDEVLQDRFNRQLIEEIEKLSILVKALEQRIVALGG